MLITQDQKCDQICQNCLVHTKWQGTLFTTNQLLHQWTNDPCVYTIANDSLVCFSWGCFLGPVWHAQVLGSSSNGSGVNRQVSTQLEIITRLARKLGHRIGYYLWYLDFKWASGETFWQCQLLHVVKPTTSVAPHQPWPPPYIMIISDSGVKTNGGQFS